jgi:hypothetical protein
VLLRVVSWIVSLSRLTARAEASRPTVIATSQSASHFQYLPGNVVGERRRKKENGARRLFGRAAAPHWNHPESDFAIRLRNAKRDIRRFARDALAGLFGLRQSGLNETEGDGVHLDVELSPFLRQRFSHSDDPGFPSCVVRLSCVAARPGG